MKLPLVLVHGWAGSADSWSRLVSRFDREVWEPIIAVRLPGSPGHNGSAPPRIGAAAAETVRTLQNLPDPAILVGHSMGAQVTLLAHTLAPELVASEVVIDPAYGPPESDRPVFAEWANRIEQSGHAELRPFFREALVGLDEATAREIMEDVERTPVDVIASYLRSEYVDPDAIGLRPATVRTAVRRRRPLLAIHSNETAAANERSLQPPTGSRIDLWPGYGHFLHLQDPDRFAAVLDQWGRTLTRAGITAGVTENR